MQGVSTQASRTNASKGGASAQEFGLKQYAVKNEKLEAKNHYINYLAGKN
jgi:hypothetical protein